MRDIIVPIILSLYVTTCTVLVDNNTTKVRIEKVKNGCK